jgi:hypothetical protein
LKVDGCLQRLRGALLLWGPRGSSGSGQPMRGPCCQGCEGQRCLLLRPTYVTQAESRPGLVDLDVCDLILGRLRGGQRTSHTPTTVPTIESQQRTLHAAVDAEDHDGLGLLKRRNARDGRP